jgi:hypothetical protein
MFRRLSRRGAAAQILLRSGPLHWSGLTMGQNPIASATLVPIAAAVAAQSEPALQRLRQWLWHCRSLRAQPIITFVRRRDRRSCRPGRRNRGVAADRALGARQWRGIAPGARRGFGLLGMQERVQALGGDYAVAGGDGGGTQVSVISMPVRLKPTSGEAASAAGMS